MWALCAQPYLGYLKHNYLFALGHQRTERRCVHFHASQSLFAFARRLISSIIISASHCQLVCHFTVFFRTDAPSRAGKPSSRSSSGPLESAVSLSGCVPGISARKRCRDVMYERVCVDTCSVTHQWLCTSSACKTPAFLLAHFACFQLWRLLSGVLHNRGLSWASGCFESIRSALDLDSKVKETSVSSLVRCMLSNGVGIDHI